MFLLIGEAYRQIELDHNPHLRDLRKRMETSYEKSGMGKRRRSRRPDAESYDFSHEDAEPETYTGTYDWNEEKFLRRWRY